MLGMQVRVVHSGAEFGVGPGVLEAESRGWAD